ncbi:hypothetical protein HELRODRAFT_180034 [Helobdella robusta]|uniref:Uncharacterized protein n=1 Tax=Helobdella robusta TaxID=6412 RepID=T1FFD5_HELRO|nr:hypothetical protein HELRODRAFT_180034 [Helobdella robusta]ESN94927.1 hypothetical protein HELRODRAFT_180034 [Helobdella robusta]
MAMLTNRKSNVHSALSLCDVMAKHPRHPSLLHIKKHNVQERRKIFENNSSDASQNALSPTIKNYSTNQSQVDDIKQSISANRANDNKERIPFFIKEKMANDRKHFFDIQENLDDDTVDNTYQESRSDFSKNKEEEELSNKYNYCTNFSTNPTFINENNDLTRKQTKTSTSSTTTTAPRKALFFDHDSSDEIFSYKSWLDKKESAERLKKLNKDVTNTDNSEIDSPEKSHYSLLNKNRSSTSNDNQKKVDETATSFLTKINSISKIYDCEQRSNIADDASTNIKPFLKASQSRVSQSGTNQSCNNQSSPSQQSTNLSKTSKETSPTINTSPDDLRHTKYLRSGSIPDHLPPKPPRLLQNLTSNNLKVSMINNTYYNEGGDVNNNNRSKKSLNSSPIYEFLTNTHSAMLPSYKTADEKSPACQTSKSFTFPKEGSPTSETLASLSYCKSDEEEAEDMLNDRSVYMRGFSIEERFYVKSKVSDAYAILRMEHQGNDPYFNSPMDNNSRSFQENSS